MAKDQQDWSEFDWSKPTFREKVEHVLLSTNALKDDRTAPIYRLAAQLLSAAAGHFRTLSAENDNPAFKEQMDENANVFAKMAGILWEEPERLIGGKRAMDLCVPLLKDAAAHLRSLGKHNPELGDDSREWGEVFESLADALEKDPYREI